MSANIDALLDEVIKVEGGYVNDPRDAGGETNFGITKAVAVANGYKGAMKALPVSVAKEIYRKKYWSEPKFDKVAETFPDVAAELFDIGVNMGQGTAVKFLQRALNAFNNQQKDYKDIAVDGGIGPGVLGAVASYKAKRGAAGESTLLKAILCLRGARYIELCEKREANEAFAYGWIGNRINFH